MTRSKIVLQIIQLQTNPNNQMCQSQQDIYTQS